MTISTVFGSKPALAALRDRTWAHADEAFAFAEVAPVNRAFPDVVEGRYDAAELALITFLQAFDNDRPITLLPVTLLGRFQHHTLVTMLGADEISADALAGRRIGVRSWSQTTVAWVRGFLHDDFGMQVEDVDWVVYQPGHVAGFEDPAYAKRSTSGNSLPDDFLRGALDAAVMGNDLPNDPRIRTVLADPAREAAGWYNRGGAVPINHMAVVGDDFAKANGALVGELSRVLAGAFPHPSAISSTIDLFPAGFDALTPSLDAAGRYAFEQGMTSRPITTAEIRAKTEKLTGLDLGVLTAQEEHVG